MQKFLQNLFKISFHDCRIHGNVIMCAICNSESFHVLNRTKNKFFFH